MKRLGPAGLILSLLFLWPGIAEPRVIGLCNGCHTMHNSQDDTSMMISGSGPVQALLRSNCLGCHTGANSGAFDNTIDKAPRVLQTTEPEYGATGTEGTATTLAGGNFYWSIASDASGHNVANINDTVATAPGGAINSPLKCAGSSGCHGDRSKTDEYTAIYGGHHNNDASAYKSGATVDASYRFLLGVKGKEDTTYEFRPVYNVNHNKYYGVDRASEADTAGTISSLCGQCHGDFHHGAGGKIAAAGSFGDGVWFRHPTDFDMGGAQSSSEYLKYNDGAGANNPYSVISPVATTSQTTTLNSTATVSSAAGEAIVMCLSCHRAHGTPNDDMLRWDYKAWPGGGYNGCEICHSSKD